MVDFGNNLKTLRLQNGFTQAQVTQKLGVTKSVISAYETGLRLPSYDILINISKIFRVSTDYLLGLENIRELDLSGLTEEEIQALLNLIKAMKRRKWYKAIGFTIYLVAFCCILTEIVLYWIYNTIGGIKPMGMYDRDCLSAWIRIPGILYVSYTEPR